MKEIKTFLSKIKIETVPPELQEKYDNIQLDNSISRIKLLTIIAIAAKLMDVLYNFIVNKRLQFEELSDLLNLFDYSELAIIAFFYLAIVFFKKINKKRILWLTCYLFITSCLILFELVMNSAERPADQIPFIFFVTIFLFTIMPDFKPKIFIPFAILYFLVTEYVLMLKNNSYNELYSPQFQILNIFLIILVTKLMLYNSRVRTFVNTYKINNLNENLVSANTEISKQKEDLRNYNENLEKMVTEKTKTIIELKNAVMETIAELVEHRDNTTGGHITRTSRYLKIFIDTLLSNRLYSEQTAFWGKNNNAEQLVLSAQLHDVGKIGIPDSILQKPGKLDKEEFEIMKRHTVLGGEIIKEIQKKTGEKEFLDNAGIFAVYHHEKWDGSGYPYGIAGEKIPLPARLMAIIDVYDALISERPYKKAFSHDEAIEIIREGKGSHFDPVLAELFVSFSDQLKEAAD